MNNPGFKLHFIRVVCAIFFALSTFLRAEPPPNPPEPKSSKAPAAPRTKPQIVYHVRPTSNYAATLHSQEKTQNNNELPVDSNMPTSLQLSHSNANADARAQQQQQEQQQQSAQQRSQKRPRVQKSHGKPPQSFGKSKEHGNKGHKH
jgi:hypothetical protein